MQHMIMDVRLVLAGLLCLSTAVPASAQQPETYQLHQMTGALMTPARRDVTTAHVRQLQVPAGFTVSIFARGLENPRMLAVADDGTIYATQPNANNVVALRDDNGDGLTDTVREVVTDLEKVHGVTVNRDRLYLATATELLVSTIRDDGSVSQPRLVVDDLPDGGQHPNRTLAVRNGHLYLSIGSSCNACDETNDEHATMVRMRLDGSERTVYAKGLRNTIGFDWHPETGQLWGMDHGSDWRGNDIPPEELNRIEEKGDYGWPFCYGAQHVDVYLSSDPEGASKEEYCAETRVPALTYVPHSAPMGLVFYTGSQFPSDYRGDAFVTLRGSWNRNPLSGYKVVRVHFENGQPVEIEDFVTGFLLEDDTAYFGRPVGIVQARDGSLLFADDTNGVIYRVHYTDAAQAAENE